MTSVTVAAAVLTCAIHSLRCLMLIDESESMELDTVPREAYWEVVDHCYLCDMCYMTKCPYVPPHEWNVDFPHLMLRAKAVKFKKGEVRARDRILTSTDNVGKLAGIPVVAQIVNASNKTGVGRKLLDKVLGVHPDAILPEYHSSTLRKRLGKQADESGRSRGCRPNPWQGCLVCDLLLQLQRTRDW